MWGFDLIIHPQVGEFDFPLDQIPTISPPSPYWGGWGLTLIGALLPRVYTLGIFKKILKYIICNTVFGEIYLFIYFALPS